ncbi:MAG TPA: M28 family peptidase [Acidobacteriota bacterium]|nr:M28 family peptidase [Acidobacteriota bacterium]
MRTIRRISILLLLTLTPVMAQEDFMRHLRYLASDELRGRGNYDPQTELAAEYIADAFRSLNLEPAGSEGSYFQSFQLPVQVSVGPDSSVRFLYGGIYPTLQREFELIGYGWPSRTVSAPLVFAGYGISAADYDDYQGLDVEGKIALILEGEPPLAGGPSTPYSTLRYKIANARDHGAAGILFAQGPRLLRSDRQRLESGKEIHSLGIPAFRASSAWSWSFRGFLGSREEAINRSLTPRSSPIEGLRAQLRVEVNENTREARNVLGFIQGRSDEVIVLGAHYDHVGLGGPETHPELLGQIHNGADDNASGTSALLSLARELALGPTPSRSILLIAFAGEELGLLGSRHFMRQPTIDPARMICMINLDMVGRSQGEILVLGAGTAEEFEPLLRSAQRRTPLRIRTFNSPSGRSDHQPFAEAGIPVLFFTTGLHHAQYHHPDDDWPLIEVSRSIEVINLVQSVMLSLDRMPQRPQPIDLLPQPDTLGLLGQSNGVLLGIRSDANWPYPGLRLRAVDEDTPAFEAGLIEGDILIGFDGRRIDDMYDFTLALEGRSAGEDVDVMVLRQDRLLILPVRLGQREADVR